MEHDARNLDSTGRVFRRPGPGRIFRDSRTATRAESKQEETVDVQPRPRGSRCGAVAFGPARDRGGPGIDRGRKRLGDIQSSSGAVPGQDRKSRWIPSDRLPAIRRR